MDSIRQFDRHSYRAIVTEQGRKEVLPAKLCLVLEAYLRLIRFDVCLGQGDFEALYNKVRIYPIGNQISSANPIEPICSAVDIACIWYRKEVLCLQRSATTACLLRKYGVSAQMVVGAQQMPFKAHAWVEVDGKVVNDKQYVPQMYEILARC